MVVAQLVRALDCDSKSHGFDSLLSPKNLYMFLNIKISSKNKNSILSLENFITGKARVGISYSSNITLKKKKFTVLKSPHVNKKAQEQFELRTYEQNIIIHTYQPLLVLTVLKRIKLKLYRDLSLTTCMSYNNKFFLKNLVKIFNSNKFFLNNAELNRNEKMKCLSSYLKVLDIQGETYFKKCLDSSVG